LRRSDLVQTLGDAFVSAIPNDYALVREAIDRGVPLDEVKPGNKVTAEIKKLVLNSTAAKAVDPQAKPAPVTNKLKLSLAR
jgi:pilus assembly protein CpaE